ncbi:MAG: transcriptional regulator [Gemmatimonas sp.]|nr:transcriptional regulator [Gemmatimonas sp.]
MLIRTSRDLGHAVRAERRALRMTQRDLAEAAGVSRQWIVSLEAGKPGAELDLVLRACNSLGVQLEVHTPKAAADAPTTFPDVPPAPSGRRHPRVRPGRRP